jgi:predicted RNA binding protein YcfA (HicA-like mRNA interferase family)
MRIPRNVDGRDFANHLIRRWEFQEERQTGSHIILRTQHPQPHTVSVPAHRPMKVGTLKGIATYISVHKHVSVADILSDL